MSESKRYRSEPDDLMEKIRALEKRISQLERVPRASATGIVNRGLTVEGGAVVVRRDDFFVQGAMSIGSDTIVNDEPGISTDLYRSETVPSGNEFEDGTQVLGAQALRFATVEGATVDPDFRASTITIYDKSGEPLVSDSTNARRGFGDPVLHQTFTQGTYVSSTSTVFAFIMSSEWYMYHAHCRIRVLVQNDASNSSELRVSENGGNPSLLVQAVGLGAFQYIDLVIPRSQCVGGNNPNGNPAAINLEHRRVAGAGTIRTQVISVVGIDLSWFNPF